VGRGFHHPSARIIALARLLLAVLFLLAVLIDATQPAKAPSTTYMVLGVYALFAAGLVAATWNNWWLDARLAGPAHAIDIVMFLALAFLTEGYTSPYFVLFVFLLLSAAIRWGWRETALTAALLTLLFLGEGLFASNMDGDGEAPLFIARSGQLVIVSLILIWFGANQWRARFAMGARDNVAEPSLDKSPLETALAGAMRSAGAGQGAIAWRDARGKGVRAITMRNGRPKDIVNRAVLDGRAATPFLYDIENDHGLMRDAERNLRSIDPVAAIGPEAAAAMEAREGLALPLRLDSGDALLLLEQVANLSTDHIDLGEQIAADAAAHIQRHALLKAVDESAEARSRLVLARDLHDSVVQFLAGAAFRLEAMKRSAANDRPLEPELNELKQLMMQEQSELRSFITVLRSGPEVTLHELANDLRGLAERLSKQWAIECVVSGNGSALAIPSRLHLDAHQLVREAVANAVRHAGAKSVRITLEGSADKLRIHLVNDGAEYPRFGDVMVPPQTLQERVEEAGGDVELSQGMNVTKMSISLPVRGGTTA
jgi:signal transduction histidine kinase